MAESTGFDIIPDEIWEHIVSFLHQDHVQSLSLVCKYFLSITNRHNLTLKILNPTADLLPSILHRFPNVTHLSLSDFDGDSVPVLHRIAEFKLPLQTLDLSNQDRLPVEALHRFPASSLSGVKSLKICYLLEGVDDADLKTIASFFPNLEELDLSCQLSKSSYYVDDGFDGRRKHRWWNDVDKIATVDGISVLASKLKGCLRRINLRGNDWVSDEIVISICRNCPNLEEIVLEHCYEVTEKAIAFALSTCQNLKTIGLQGMKPVVCKRIHEPLSHALNLSHVVFSNIVVSDALLNVMANAKLPLKSFSLIECTLVDLYNGEALTFAGLLSFLETYDSLHHLALVGVDFLSDALMETLANSLKMVRTVRLQQQHRYLHLSDLAMVSLIQQCPLLQTLEINHSNYIKGGSGLCGITNAEIRTLDLSFNNNLTDECLENIASACPKLERLILRSCPKITNKGVGEILSKCHSLKHLKMSHCSKVKSLGLEHMNTDDNQHLELQFLGASMSGLEDKALIEMAGKCPHLRSLNVEGCKRLTTEGVKQAVDKLTRLKEINLRGCQNVSKSIVPWMVFSKQSMRKIVSPEKLGDMEEKLYQRQGCYTEYRYKSCLVLPF